MFVIMAGLLVLSSSTSPKLSNQSSSLFGTGILAPMNIISAFLRV